jgi:hypothetical protein
MDQGYWSSVGDCIGLLQCQFETYFGVLVSSLRIATERKVHGHLVTFEHPMGNDIIIIWNARGLN